MANNTLTKESSAVTSEPIKPRGRPKTIQPTPIAEKITVKSIAEQVVEQIENVKSIPEQIEEVEQELKTETDVQIIADLNMEDAFLKIINSVKKFELVYRDEVIFNSNVHYNMPITTSEKYVEVFNRTYPYMGLEVRILQH